MNCKPFDLAVIVSVPVCQYPEAQAALNQLIGRFVRVLTVAYGSVWSIEKPITYIDVLGAPEVVDHVEDQYLRPIRGVPVTDEVTEEITA